MSINVHEQRVFLNADVEKRSLYYSIFYTKTQSPPEVEIIETINILFRIICHEKNKRTSLQNILLIICSSSTHRVPERSHEAGVGSNSLGVIRTIKKVFLIICSTRVHKVHPKRSHERKLFLLWRCRGMTPSPKLKTNIIYVCSGIFARAEGGR